jgi:hypothetical protein
MKPLSFERLDIDGIAAYIGNRSGPVVAGLTFRVGVADEAPFERGMTSLVAELAAIDVDAVEFEVGMAVTTFVARGDAHEVTDALAAVCGALGTFGDDDLTQLADTVLDEWPKPPSLRTMLLTLRYGAHDHGVAALPPLGLLRVGDRVGDDAARAWASRVFTRGNAALWSTGPLAANASLPLPPGERMVPLPRPESECATPAWCPNVWLGAMFHDAIDCTLVASMSAATPVAVRALEDEIVERLADTPLSGTTPEILLGRWSDDLGYLTLSLDTAASGNDGVETLLGSLDDFAELGPDPDELAAATTSIWRWATDHDNAELVAEMLAGNELRTGRARKLDAFLGSLDAVRADDVQQVFTELRASIMLAVPADADIVAPQITLLDRARGIAVGGTTYRRTVTTGAPVDDGRLVVGADGVTYTTDDQVLTVFYEDCAAAVGYPDQSVALYDVDGTTIEFSAADWRDGAQAYAAVVAALGSETMLVARRTLGSQSVPFDRAEAGARDAVDAD